MVMVNCFNGTPATALWSPSIREGSIAFFFSSFVWFLMVSMWHARARPALPSAMDRTEREYLIIKLQQINCRFRLQFICISIFRFSVLVLFCFLYFQVKTKFRLWKMINMSFASRANRNASHEQHIVNIWFVGFVRFIDFLDLILLLLLWLRMI